MLEFDLDEVDDMINMLYSINPANLHAEQYKAIEKVTSWLVLMLQEADGSGERGQ